MKIQTLSTNPACNPNCQACHYKTLTYTEQVRNKQIWAKAQLHEWIEVLSEFKEAPEEDRLAYRSKTWLKAKVEGEELSLGMTRAINISGKWETEFISWNTCPLHMISIQQMIESLRRDLIKMAADWVKTSLVGIWIGVPHVVLIARQPATSDILNFNWLDHLIPPFNQVWYHQNSEVGKNIFGHHPVLKIGGTEKNLSHPVKVFRQVAQKLLIEARNEAVKNLLRDGPEQILDLYCGTGEIALLLPSNVGWVGIELSSAAVEFANSLRKEADLSEGVQHKAFVGAVEQRLNDPQVMACIVGRSYSLYINPPRSGLSAEGRKKILEFMKKDAPKTVVYLSCSASSLARDLREFVKVGFEVESLRCYDFFPQTEHFETLVILGQMDREKRHVE